MKRSIFALLSVVILLSILATACTQDAIEEPIESPEAISGLIYSVGDNVILVVGGIADVNIPREALFESGYRAVYFTVTDETEVELNDQAVSLNQLARGQSVDVWHEGFLAESYPEQGAATRIVIKDDTAAGDYQTDSGRFMGINDNGQVMVKISGVPDELPAREFQLTAEAADLLERMALEPEEAILFNFLPDENSDGLIFDLSRITD